MAILDHQRRTGGCQCGALRFVATALVDNAHVCHCRMCQRATGNFFAPLVGVPNADLQWTSGTPAVFASSQGVERGFCRDCGTPMFFRRTEGAHTSVNIPTFDDPGAIALEFEFGVEGRLPQMTQLGHLPAYVTEEAEPESAAAIRRSNRQFRLPDGGPRCLIPRFDGAIFSQEWKEALWDKFVTGAPRPRTPSELQYSDRKLRSRN